MRTTLALAALLVTACSSSSTPVPSGTTPPAHVAAAPAPAPSPATPPPATRFTSVSCGFGGSATAVSALVDADVAAPMHGVTATYELRDPSSGRVYGRATPPLSLLVSPPGRDPNDFSTQGTSPFAGDLAAGQHVRLQVFGGVDGTPPLGPAEIRTTFTAADGSSYVVTCEAPSMWPSS